MTRFPGPGWRRAGRRTNVALLLLLVATFVTGVLSFATARSAPAVTAALAHGLVGTAILVLVPWKTVVVRRARTVRPASVFLTIALVVCLAAGFGQALIGYRLVLGLSPMQVHVATALLAVGLLVWHVVRSRRQRLRRSDLTRRALLRTAVGLGTAAAATAALAGVAEVSRGPARRPASTGSREVDATSRPPTIWLSDTVPALDPDTFRVDVAGCGYSVADLRARAQTVRARLDCTNGWYAEADWSGVPLRDLLPAEPLARAVSLEVVSVTGYGRRFPASAAADLWLAVGCAGLDLTSGTGAPVRLVAPGRRGFWWVKWVGTVRLSPVPAWRQLPFPAQ